MQDGKECGWCGKTLLQRPDEKDQNYENRSHCNKSCSGKDRPRQKRTEKIAVVISDNLFRSRYR